MWIFGGSSVASVESQNELQTSIDHQSVGMIPGIQSGNVISDLAFYTETSFETISWCFPDQRQAFPVTAPNRRKSVGGGRFMQTTQIVQRTGVILGSQTEWRKTSHRQIQGSSETCSNHTTSRHCLDTPCQQPPLFYINVERGAGNITK